MLFNYSDSNAVSGESPNWQAHLMLPRDLIWLRNQSTHWRATCRYNADGVVYTDYLRASFGDFDIIGTEALQLADGVCQRYELVNIRGNECTKCTARTWYLLGFNPLHIDSSNQYGCDFNGNMTGDVLADEDNFGLYNVVNPKFRCTSSSQATTQFWVGSQ